MQYKDQNKLSEKKWMESVMNQMGFKFNEGIGEDAMDAKMYFHDKLKEVLSYSASAYKSDDLKSINDFLRNLIRILPSTATNQVNTIKQLMQEISNNLQQQQTNGQTDKYGNRIALPGETPPLPNNYR
jgi:hypothetical protein